MRALPRRAVVVALALAAACKAGEGPTRVGQPLPAFTLPDLDGTEVTSASLAGRPVLLNFWATWCGPCVREMPLLQRLDDEGRVAVVGIALDEDGARSVRPFVARRHVRYKILLGNQEVFQRLGGFGIPHSVLLDRSQIVRAVYRGELTRESLEADLRAMGPS